MAHSSNMDPPKSKKHTKRKNQLRISQPIHHQQNIIPQSNIPSNTNSIDRLHSPHRKKPRHSKSPHSHSSNTSLHNNINSNKIPKKGSHIHHKPKPVRPKPSDFASYHPTHIYSSISPLESDRQIMSSLTQDSLINFSCISYDSLVEYCKMFKLHEFKYNYHYHLAHHSHIASEDMDTDTPHSEMSARISKREIDDSDGEDRNKNKKKRKRRNRKRVRENETKHHYLNSAALDTHYEKVKRDRVPKTFDPSTRLTKSELVQIVKHHFLSTPLLKDLNEIDVIKQFLMFIQERRKKLKKEFGFQ